MDSAGRSAWRGGLDNGGDVDLASGKHLKRYKELATRNGRADPLQYLFDRFEVLRRQEKHDEAIELAKTLVPYGHRRLAPEPIEEVKQAAREGRLIVAPPAE